MRKIVHSILTKVESWCYSIHIRLRCASGTKPNWIQRKLLKRSAWVQRKLSRVLHPEQVIQVNRIDVENLTNDNFHEYAIRGVFAEGKLVQGSFLVRNKKRGYSFLCVAEKAEDLKSKYPAGYELVAPSKDYPIKSDSNFSYREPDHA